MWDFSPKFHKHTHDYTGHSHMVSMTNFSCHVGKIIYTTETFLSSSGSHPFQFILYQIDCSDENLSMSRLFLCLLGLIACSNENIHELGFFEYVLILGLIGFKALDSCMHIY